MQKGSGFPEYTLVLLGIAIVVSIALAGLAGVYGEMAEWMKERSSLLWKKSAIQLVTKINIKDSK